MASTYSALKIELIGTGEQTGTWGTTTNNNLGDAALGEAITGSATVNFSTAADVTITLTDVNTTQSARNLRLNITESSTGIGYVGNLILGSGCQIEKFYLINNTGTGAKTVKNTSGTGISVPAGKATLVFNDGTNVVDAASYFSSLTLGTVLPVASGGTGAATLTGVIKGNGTSAITAATAGTDYVAPTVATTFTALQTFNGTSALGALKTVNINEPATVSATASTGTINFDVTTQSVLYYTTNATGNFTINFRASSGTSLNTLMATGDSICVSFLCTNGATAYYNSLVQVDGSTVTPKWQGGTAPTSGNASAVDAYNYVILKTGANAYTILASQTKFA